MLQTFCWRQYVAARPRSTSVSSPVSVTAARLSGGLLRRPESEYERVQVCWCAVVSECNSSGMFNRRRSTDGWQVIAVEQNWSQLLFVEGAARRMHVTELLSFSE